MLSVGVLALQGDVREHLITLNRLGITAIPVRRSTELAAVDGIVLPGGESTTMCRLLDVFELREPLVERLTAGLPVFGSCAGMILLGSTILDGRVDQQPLGIIDMTVRRNAFGRQVDSFEADVEVDGLDGGPVRGVFIRAPWVERVGPEVTVLARVDGHPVAVRQANALAVSFHPEVAGEDRLHRLFLSLVARSKSALRHPSSVGSARSTGEQERERDDERSFQVGHHQAPKGGQGRQAGQALRQVDQECGGRRSGGRR